MARRSKATLLLVIALLASLNFGVSAASAHSDLVSSDPAADSVLEAMPESVLLTFNEDLLVLEGAEDANQVIVTDSAGTNLATAEPTVAANTISSPLLPSDAQGLVTVTYRVVSADGHPIEGSYSFTVGQPILISPSTEVQESHSNASGDWTAIFLGLVATFTLVALILILRRKTQRKKQ